MLWEDLEGAGGEGGGRGDRDGEDMWTQGLFISMYDKIHYQKKKKKKIHMFLNICLFLYGNIFQGIPSDPSSQDASAPMMGKAI